MPLATTDPAIEQTIIHQQARINQLEAAERERSTSMALSSAIDAAGVTLNPGAREQLVTLLRSEVSHVTTADGRLVPAGPGLKSLNDHVRETLAKPEWSHFARGGPSAPAGQTRPAAGLLPEADPNETLGGRIIRAAAEQRASQAARPPAHSDLSQSFGLGPRR